MGDSIGSFFGVSRKPQPFPTAQPIFTIYFISAAKTATVYCNKANICKRDGWRADLGEKFTRRQFPCIAGLRTETVRLFFAHRQLRQQGFDNVKSLWKGRDGVWGREGKAFLQKSFPSLPQSFSSSTLLQHYAAYGGQPFSQFSCWRVPC